MLRAWNWREFRDINTRVDNTQCVMDGIQSQTESMGHSESLLQQEDQATFSLNEALRLEEAIYPNNSRARWVLEGDHNTKKFHALVKYRKIQQSLVVMCDGSSIIVGYFQNLFNSDDTINTGLVQKVTPHPVTDSDNSSLLVIPYPEKFIWC